MLTAMAAQQFVQFSAGAVVGVFVGLFLGPLLKSWLAWREWVEASREADLTDRLLERFEDADSRLDDASMAQGVTTSDDRRSPEQQIGGGSAADSPAKASLPLGVSTRAAKRSRA